MHGAERCVWALWVPRQGQGRTERPSTLRTHSPRPQAQQPTSWLSIEGCCPALEGTQGSEREQCLLWAGGLIIHRPRNLSAWYRKQARQASGRGEWM